MIRGVWPAAVLLLAACSSGAPQQPGGGMAGMDHGGMSMSAPLPTRTVLARAGDLSIAGGYVPEPASPDVAAAYLTIVNHGGRADTVTAIRTDVTRGVRAMTDTAQGAMTAVVRIEIPAHGSFVFRRGQAHLMLENPTRALRPGDWVSMTITFARAGAVRFTLPVVPVPGMSG